MRRGNQQAPPKTANRVMKRQRHASADIVMHRKNMKELKEQMDSLDRPPSRQRSPFLFHLAESFRKQFAFRGNKGGASAVKYAFQGRKSNKDAKTRPPSRGRRSSAKNDLVLTAHGDKKSSSSSKSGAGAKSKKEKGGGAMWGEKVGRAAMTASASGTLSGVGDSGGAASKEKLANVCRIRGREGYIERERR